MQRTDSLEKTLMLERFKEEKGMMEDEMVGWHHQLNEHEFEQALRVGDGQGSLTCYSPWGHKESDMTKQLNWTDTQQIIIPDFCHPFTILVNVYWFSISMDLPIHNSYKKNHTTCGLLDMPSFT